MRRLTPLSLLILILVLATTAQAQGSLDTTIASLQKQIQVRDAINRDRKTPSDLRILNRRVLEAKRGELREAVRQRISQLQNYLANLGPASTREERQFAETSLRYLVSIRDGVPVVARAADAPALSQTGNAAVRPRSGFGAET